MPIVRDPASRGRAGSWRRLWSGYIAFYGSEISEVVTAATWRRMLDSTSPIFGRLADCQFGSCWI